MVIRIIQMSLALRKNVLAYILALTLLIGILFTVRHRISFFNSSTITLSLDQLTEAQVVAQKYFDEAKAGDANAMNALGLLYAQGQIGKVAEAANFEKAFQFFKMAAELDNSDAKNSMGSLLLAGAYGKIGDKVDMDLAVEYFQAAADQGNLEALNNLATLYRTGTIGAIDGKPNYSKAVEIYNRQVDLNDSRGLVNLATMYINGESVEKNISRASDLLNSAIKLNNPVASRIMGELYFAALIGKDANYTKAAEYYNNAISGGDSGAMVNMGSLYMSGKFGKVADRPNFEAALDLYRKAAQNNNPSGLTNIGTMYYAGILSEEGRDSLDIAKQLWTQAASLGDSGAKRNLEVLERKRLEKEAAGVVAKKNEAAIASLEPEHQEPTKASDASTSAPTKASDASTSVPAKASTSAPATTEEEVKQEEGVQPNADGSKTKEEHKPAVEETMVPAKETSSSLKGKQVASADKNSNGKKGKRKS
jgi:TPR repeat protein